MAWVTMRQISDGNLQTVVDEIKDGSHRAIALVLAAFVEEHLTLLIRSQMAQDVTILDERFRAGGALADFGVKADLGYLLGIYSKAARKELDTIRRIRNEFAHKVKVRNFGVQPVKDWSKNLTIWEDVKIKIGRDKGGDGHVMSMGKNLEIGEQEVPIRHKEDSSSLDLPHERYIAACQFFITAFTILINTNRADWPSPLII